MAYDVNIRLKGCTHLFVLLQAGVKLLGQVIGYIRHPRLLLVGSADAALVFVGFFVVLLLGVFAVHGRALRGMERDEERQRRRENRGEEREQTEEREEERAEEKTEQRRRESRAL